MGTIVPLLKDSAGDVTSMDNYRGITLGSITSKLYELVLLQLYGGFLRTGENQFGFKRKSGTADALYVFKSTVEYFTNKGSNVFSCFVDSSKAFDRVCIMVCTSN